MWVYLTEIEKELNQDVDGKMSMRFQVFEGKAPDDEKDGEDYEAAQLNGFTSDRINQCNCGPVSRNGACENKDTVSSCEVIQVCVHFSF